MHIASCDVIIVCMCTCKSCHVCSVVLSLCLSKILTVHVTDERYSIIHACTYIIYIKIMHEPVTSLYQLYA